ncbi:hypothetical protein [Arenibacter certesii]|uniref:Uncharacterized protein n=1 Tax=Arenibacter certesii TaxID=228955 RepID=A0A918MRV5_9FLAO|nr:hypothetical protein [Arenibacter certesii]GGW48841.1 hypothetical protein GCM10007383_36110 [Arenibacter certesii]
MKKIILLLLLVTGNFLFAQVGIGTDLPNPSTQLEIKSSNRGVLIPQVPLTSNTDKTTISAGNLESLLVYNISTTATLTPGYYYWYQDRWERLLSDTDLPDYIVNWDVANNQFTYKDTNGNLQNIDIAGLQALTVLELNADGHTLEYADEDGIVTSIDLAEVIKNFETLTTVVANTDGSFSFTDERGNATVIDVSNLETLTTIALNGDNTNLDYTDENGVVTQVNLTALVKNLETLTTVAANTDGTFTFTDEAGQPTIIDVSNLQTLTTLVLNADNTHIDYTDEHGVVTQLNLTDLVKNLETLTVLDYDITTNRLSYKDESGAIKNINLGVGSVIYDGITNTITYKNANGVDTDLVLNHTNLTYDTDLQELIYVNSLGVTQTIGLAALVAANTINRLELNNTELTSTVNGVAASVDLRDVIQAEQKTTTVVDGMNTTVESETVGDNINYKVNVNTASGASLGVVKEAATQSTVKINEDGELSIDLTNLNRIVETSVSYTVSLKDAIILGNTNGGHVNITLPNATLENKGKRLTIKKQDGNENYYLMVFGAIDGLSELYTALPYSGWELISNGIEWKIINKF